MPNYYADSSALVKRHINETGTAWLKTTLATSGTAVATAQISVVEVFAALNRRIREGSLNQATYAGITADFESLCAAEYQIVELSVTVLRQARELLERHPLRAYDAVQLASALVTRDAFVAAELDPPIFLSADDRLLDAARAEGMPVDNPNQY